MGEICNMKIIRSEYSTVRNTYEIELDAKYIVELNNYLQEKCAQREQLPYLESEDIAYIFENRWNDTEFDKEYEWCRYGSSVYSQSLSDFVYEIIEEDLWNTDPEEEYLDTYDVTMEVEY